MMTTGELLNIQPLELKFVFELKKQISCSLQLSNKIDSYVAFKVKTTNPKKYCVRPNTGVILPNSTCDVTVTMQAQKEAPSDMQCKDKFLLQSVRVFDGATPTDLTPEMVDLAHLLAARDQELRTISTEIDENVEREIINHRSLRHPNIVRFKEVILTPTHLAIVMEYASGGELFDRVSSAVSRENIC